MPLTATVTARPRARRAAGMAPAMSIWDMIQALDISPWGLASVRRASTRMEAG
jgi:hypothetical protein